MPDSATTPTVSGIGAAAFIVSFLARYWCRSRRIRIENERAVRAHNTLACNSLLGQFYNVTNLVILSEMTFIQLNHIVAVLKPIFDEISTFSEKVENEYWNQSVVPIINIYNNVLLARLIELAENIKLTIVSNYREIDSNLTVLRLINLLVEQEVNNIYLADKFIHSKLAVIYALRRTLGNIKPLEHIYRQIETITWNAEKEDYIICEGIVLDNQVYDQIFEGVSHITDMAMNKTRIEILVMIYQISPCVYAHFIHILNSVRPKELISLNSEFAFLMDQLEDVENNPGNDNLAKNIASTIVKLMLYKKENFKKVEEDLSAELFFLELDAHLIDLFEDKEKKIQEAIIVKKYSCHSKRLAIFSTPLKD